MPASRRAAVRVCSRAPGASCRACAASAARPSFEVPARQRLTRMPTTGARITGRLILSRLTGPIASVASSRCASGPVVVWLSTKPSSSTRRVRFSAEPLRNTAGSSRLMNSRMRSRLTLSSNMMVHLRWCCWRSGTRRPPAWLMSRSSLHATVNSVMVQLSVLNRRLRKASNTSGCVAHTSCSRRWYTGLASSAALGVFWPKPRPLMMRSRMVEMGIQKRPSKAASRLLISCSRATGLCSNAVTYSRYCSSIEMLCSSTSRRSGLMMRASLKCVTRKVSTSCSPWSISRKSVP
mmetsp:Transcript_34159/g.87349  ORF Transcript_34159/g.87349 Transcript_34159/m.87349 type:complete len:293 (+) Transcript_34159:504-1382(+)